MNRDEFKLLATDGLGYRPKPDTIYFSLHGQTFAYTKGRYCCSRRNLHYIVAEKDIFAEDEDFLDTQSQALKVYFDTTGAISEQDCWYSLGEGYWLFYNVNDKSYYHEGSEDNAYLLIGDKEFYPIREPKTPNVVEFRPRPQLGWSTLEDGRRHLYCIRYYGSPGTGNGRRKQSKLTLSFNDSKISVFDVSKKDACGAYVTKHGKVVIWHKTSNFGFRQGALNNSLAPIVQSWIIQREKYGSRFDKYKIRTTKVVTNYAGWLLKSHPILLDSGLNRNVLQQYYCLPRFGTLREYVKYIVGSKSRSTVRKFLACKSPDELYTLILSTSFKGHVTPTALNVLSSVRNATPASMKSFVAALPTSFKWESCLEMTSYGKSIATRNWRDCCTIWHSLPVKPKINSITADTLHEALLVELLKVETGRGYTYHYKCSIEDEETGISLRTPVGTGEVSFWGKKQGHCIGSYASQKETILLEVTHPDHQVAHCALQNISGKWSPIQVYHSGNRSLDPVYAQRILYVLHKYKVRLSQLVWSSGGTSFELDSKYKFSILENNKHSTEDSPFRPQKVELISSEENT